MHKIANVDVNVKYRRPGNVVAYVPVIFEVYQKGNKFDAIPFVSEETKILTNLPTEITFRMQNETIYEVSQRYKEVVESLVERLKAFVSI